MNVFESSILMHYSPKGSTKKLQKWLHNWMETGLMSLIKDQTLQYITWSLHWIAYISLFPLQSFSWNGPLHLNFQHHSNLWCIILLYVSLFSSRHSNCHSRSPVVFRSALCICRGKQMLLLVQIQHFHYVRHNKFILIWVQWKTVKPSS